MMDSRNIKVWFCVACLASTLALPAPSSNSSPQLYLDIIDMAAISRMSPQQLETLAEGLAAEEIMRTKRSSAQESVLSSVVSKASAGLQSKVGLLGQASAFISSASSKSGDEHQGYSYEPHPEKYDYWGLKKSILYTLFQAVKAITGGVTILKGQLIKGGGALASTLGKVIAGKGDVVSNIGKKIVSSAALSHKKQHAVYGPPPPAHVEYGPPPSAYGVPTAPAHYVAPSLTTGYAAHKYPSTLDGRGKLSGVHAGLVFLAPLGENPHETLETAHSGHTALDPPPSILHTVYSAIKNVFNKPVPVEHGVPVAHTAPATHTEYSGYTAPAAPTGPSGPSDIVNVPYSHQPPPSPQSFPQFKPMAWGAVDSYGQPAAAETYPDFDPRHPHPPFDYAAVKKSSPTIYPTHKTGLTADKVQKINFNLNKLRNHMNHQARSSEVLPQFNGLDAYREMLKKGLFMPTPVVTDNEIGVLPAELLPDSDTTSSTPSSTTSSTTTTTTTETPKTTVETRRKDVKYFLRGNKIIQV